MCILNISINFYGQQIYKFSIIVFFFSFYYSYLWELLYLQVVAPTLHSPACQEQLTGAVREVARAVENLVAVCNDSSTNKDLINQLEQAAEEVTRTLNDLLNHIKLGKKYLFVYFMLHY